MAYVHITASGAVNQYTSATRKVLLQVNTTLTGTITVSDEAGTTGVPVVAVITNPTVGTLFEYGSLKNGVTVNPSATCDITVFISTSQGNI